MNWPEYFYDMANLVAKKSKDQSTQIGAVIVGPIMKFVQQVTIVFQKDLTMIYKNDKKDRKVLLDRTRRTQCFVQCSKIGVSTKDCTMYLNCGVPCCDCARGIINSGIKTIYICEHDITKSAHWIEHSKRSMEMFTESGVEILHYFSCSN